MLDETELETIPAQSKAALEGPSVAANPGCAGARAHAPGCFSESCQATRSGEMRRSGGAWTISEALSLGEEASHGRLVRSYPL